MFSLYFLCDIIDLKIRINRILVSVAVGVNELINNELVLELKDILDESDIKLNESMKNHTYFKIGGNVDLMISPQNTHQIFDAIKLLKKYEEMPQIMGNGTNLLVRDKGVRGVIIKIGKQMSEIRIENDMVTADAGALLSQIANIASEYELTGFEFAAGIPGSLGGAVAMNAGAYDGEMKDIVHSVVCLDKQGNLLELQSDELDFSYRNSIVQKNDLIVLQAKIKLEKGNKTDIKAKMKDFAERRISKQPLNLPSAGSTFKRPANDYASRLIEVNGLKGLRYGDAQVSDKHCGFIVNVGQAKCEDVLNLIKVVQKTVKDKSGVDLSTEVKIIGEI